MFKSIPVTVGAFIEIAVRILKKRQNLQKKILDDEELNIVIGNLNGGGDPLNGGDINPKCADCLDVVVFCSPITQVNYDIHFQRRNEGNRFFSV